MLMTIDLPDKPTQNWLRHAVNRICLAIKCSENELPAFTMAGDVWGGYKIDTNFKSVDDIDYHLHIALTPINK